MEQVDLFAKRISFSLVAKISGKPSEKGEATGPEPIAPTVVLLDEPG